MKWEYLLIHPGNTVAVKSWKFLHWTRNFFCTTVTMDFLCPFNDFYWECIWMNKANFWPQSMYRICPRSMARKISNLYKGDRKLHTGRSMQSWWFCRVLTVFRWQLQNMCCSHISSKEFLSSASQTALSLTLAWVGLGVAFNRKFMYFL